MQHRTPVGPQGLLLRRPADLAAQLGTDRDVLEVGIGGGEAAGFGDGLVEVGVDAAGARLIAESLSLRLGVAFSPSFDWTPAEDGTADGETGELAAGVDRSGILTGAAEKAAADPDRARLAHTNLDCSTAALTKLVNSGCGSNGLDLSSG